MSLFKKKTRLQPHFRCSFYKLCGKTIPDVKLWLKEKNPIIVIKDAKKKHCKRDSTSMTVRIVHWNIFSLYSYTRHAFTTKTL